MKIHSVNIRLLSLFLTLWLFASDGFADLTLMPVDVKPDYSDTIFFLEKIDKAETISFLLTCLNDKDPHIRSSAARATSSLHVKEAIPKLLELLSDENNVVRYYAVEALVALQAKDAIPALLSLLKDQDRDVRSSAADALGALQAKDAIPALLSLLKDENNSIEVRKLAMQTLVALQAKDAIPALLILLKDQDGNVRSSAAGALGALQAKDAIPALLSLLKDQDSNVRSSAADALGALQAKDAIPALLSLLKDQDSNVRSSAADALGALQAKDAIPALLSLLKDQYSNVRSSAAAALGALQAKEVIPTLLSLLKDGGINAYAAKKALGALQARQVIPALLSFVQDENSNGYAVDALGALQAKEAIPALLSLLKDKDSNFEFSVAVVETLGILQAKETIPALMDLLKDENLSHRASATQALAKLGEYPVMPNLVAVMSENLESSSYIASGELLDFMLQGMKNANPDTRERATIVALRTARNNNLNVIPQKLLHKAISLTDQQIHDAAAKQLANEDRQEAEEKARQLPVNQPGLEAKPLKLGELKTKLDGFDQAYADWRERSDDEPAASIATDLKAPDSEADKLADPAPFIYEYAYAIANMDEAEGIKLLGHNLAKVREAAARGLANSDFLGVPLLQKLEQEWLATDNPITRQGLFHAIDIALLAMEGIGADKELEALKAYEPTLINERSAASIKPRVEWTRIQLQWRVDALKELKELADRQLPGLLKDYCMNPDGTDMKPEECTIER